MTKLTDTQITDKLNRLAEYERLEEEGKLIKIPYKTGETVYKIDGNDIIKGIITDVGFEERLGETIGMSIFNEDNFYIDIDSVDKVYSYRCFNCSIKETIFSTREEAEAKLKETDMTMDYD